MKNRMVFNEDCYTMHDGDMWYFADECGNLSFKIRCDEVQELAGIDNCAKVRVKDKWGLINTKNEVLCEISYDEIECCGRYLAKMRLKGKWGFVNIKDKEIHEPRYDNICGYADPISHSFTRLFIEDKCGLINSEGKVICEADYDDCLLFHGFVALRARDKWGVIDESGTMQCPFNFDEVGRVVESKVRYTMPKVYYAKTRIKDKWGLIADGKEIHEPEYDEIGRSCTIDMHVEVRLKDKWGLVDRRGKQITEIEYDSISEVNAECVEASIGSKTIYIDENGYIKD